MSKRKDYRTRQRDIVLNCFIDQPRRSMTAQEVIEHLERIGQPVGRTTVYRTIALLNEKGRLVAVKDTHGTGPARYQHREQTRHISVRCSGCGLIAALTCGAVEAFERHLFLDHGFSLQEEECLLPGLCETCKSNRQNDPKGNP